MRVLVLIIRSSLSKLGLVVGKNLRASSRDISYVPREREVDQVGPLLIVEIQISPMLLAPKIDHQEGEAARSPNSSGCL